MSNVVPLTLRRHIAHRRSVPAVSVELLAEAASRLAAHREEYGPERHDVMMTIGMMLRAKRDTMSIDELGMLGMNVQGRLYALLNHFVGQRYTQQEAYAVLRGEDPEMLRTAARAPLGEATNSSSEYRFELTTFMAVLQEERAGKVIDRAADS